jgi:hypothetical protein
MTDLEGVALVLILSLVIFGLDAITKPERKGKR